MKRGNHLIPWLLRIRRAASLVSWSFLQLEAGSCCAPGESSFLLFQTPKWGGFKRHCGNLVPTQPVLPWAVPICCRVPSAPWLLAKVGLLVRALSSCATIHPEVLQASSMLTCGDVTRCSHMEDSLCANWLTLPEASSDSSSCNPLSCCHPLS